MNHRKEMKKGIRPSDRIPQRLRDEKGMIVAIAIMLTAVLAAAVLFVVIPGYQQHLRDAKVEMDSTSVATARDVASITYLQDGNPDLITYYYDEINHKCVLLDEIDSIEPYGRSAEADNLNGETGAKGIPNLGKDNGGAQLIAITFKNNEILNIRWTGKKCTVLDYDLMTVEEHNALTTKQQDELEKDRERLQELEESSQQNGDESQQNEEETQGTQEDQ